MRNFREKLAEFREILKRRKNFLIVITLGAVLYSGIILRYGARFMLFKKGISYTEQEFIRRTSIGDREAMRLLMQAGISPDTKSVEGIPAISFIAASGSPDILHTILERGANVNAADSNGWTPLMIASGGDRTELVNMLLSNGADPNAADLQGRTALMAAVEGANMDIIKALLDKGADPKAETYNGWNVRKLLDHFNKSGGKIVKTAHTEEP